MPELPEVETVRKSLDTTLRGLVVQEAVTYRADLRFPFPKNFAEKLTGCRIHQVHRWAKYLLLELETPSQQSAYWLIHLGMSGQCRLLNTAKLPEKHDHLCVDFDDGTRLYYRDPRRFGFMDWLDDPATYRAFAHIGREAILCAGTYPIAKARGLADGDYLQATLAGKQTSIKAALLDQRVIAGLGNIYINEALWEIGLDPRTRAAQVPEQLFPALATAIQETLDLALKSGGSSLRDFVHTDGKLGYFQHEWKVYGRAKQPCTKIGCTGTIVQEMQQGRSSFFCPQHQIFF